MRRIVIGCMEDDRDREAIALGRALTASLDAQLDLVHVVRGPSPERSATAQERNFQSFLAQEARAWMARARDLVPPGMRAESHVVYADSFAEGLIDAARDLGAAVIVVGASSRAPWRRFTVGSVANALLHASPVPVALAPSGYRPPRFLSRITCALGTRAGHEALLEAAVEAAALRHVPLRLLSLVTVDAHRAGEEAVGWARAHAQVVLDRAVAAVDRRTLVRADIAEGESIEEAIARLDWDEGEIVVIGSSRLAGGRRIFLGSTANKMLRALPVPMVVVPRDHPRLDAQHGGRG